MTILGNRIDARLKALDKPQEWLAEQVGMSQQGIGSIIKGKSKRPRKLREIAVALETTQEYLLGEFDDPIPFPGTEDLVAKLLQLTPADRKIALALIDSLQARRSAAKRGPSRR